MICNISLLVILTCKIDKTVCYSNCNFYRSFKVSPKVNIPVIRNLLVLLRDPPNEYIVWISVQRYNFKLGS